MDFEEALEITDTAVFNQTGKHLSDAQRAVIQGTWQRQKYHEIALVYRCTPEYLKRDVGPKLWKILSDEFQEKVSKTNFRTAVERWGQKNEPPIAPTGPADPADPVQPPPGGGGGGKPVADWGEATDISGFRGRDRELGELKRYILAENCRIVALLGMGGIGKTSLSVQLARRIGGEFDYLIWRSLRNAPPLTEILEDLIRFLCDEVSANLPDDPYRQISVLIECLRSRRCLVILDNAESILQGGDRAGRYHSGYENYGELFKRIGESQHRSCLLITSREKPKEIAALEGRNLAIRSFPLLGLPPEDCHGILRDKKISGSPEQWRPLIERYAGNPLAIKIVTTTICDLFGGDIGIFLDQIHQGTAIFGDIRDLLEQQLSRLSPVEQELMYWLAINREPVTMAELQKDLLSLMYPRSIIEALESLSRRSLIEKNATRFTQQPVVMEYMIERLIEQTVAELQSENLVNFNRYALIKSQAKDYILESQNRVILQPIVRRLADRYPLRRELERKFNSLLDQIKRPEIEHFSVSQHDRMGYAGGNLINLCHQFDLDLANYDFSDLTIWQAYLQDANLQNVNFSGSDLSRSVFAKTLGNSLTVALGIDGKLLATGDGEGRLVLWSVEDGQQLRVFQGRVGRVRAIAFNSDATLLASGSDDRTVRLWRVETGDCLNRFSLHDGGVSCVCFSCDSRLLASGGDDEIIAIWDVKTGTCIRQLCGHEDSIRSLAFSPDGRTLASSGEDCTVKLWDVETGKCERTFVGDSSWNWTVTFVVSRQFEEDISSPRGRAIACSCDDKTIRLWDVQMGRCFYTLEGHQDSVWAMAFSDNGRLLASGSDDQTVKIWHVGKGYCEKTLPGFDTQISSLALSPDLQYLATGGEEQVVQLWDIDRGQRLRTLRGHRHQVWSFALSPDGRTLASGSDDSRVRIWDVKTGRCLRRCPGHGDWVWSVAFTPDGRTLASGSYDRTVKLWDVRTGECLKTLHGHGDRVQAVAFSPDGLLLASGSDDLTVKLWDVQTGECLGTLEGHDRWVGAIAFSPDSHRLASGGNDQTARLWDVETGDCLRVIEGHTHRIHLLMFAPDGARLATGSYDRTVKLWDLETGTCTRTWEGNIDRVQGLLICPDGQLCLSGSDDLTVRLWDIETGENAGTYAGHTSPVWSVHGNADGSLLASGSHDQAIRIWDATTGECLQILRTDKPYDGLNITGVTGITPAQRATLKALGAIDLDDAEN